MFLWRNKKNVRNFGCKKCLIWSYGPLSHTQTMKAQISLQFQGDQGLHCLLTGSLNAVEYVYESRKSVIRTSRYCSIYWQWEPRSDFRDSRLICVITGLICYEDIFSSWVSYFIILQRSFLYFHFRDSALDKLHLGVGIQRISSEKAIKIEFQRLMPKYK